MMTREEKKLLIRNVMAGQWWLDKYKEYFTEDFSMELPFAPPGMTQAMPAGQVAAHKLWLAHTVKSWDTEVLYLHGPKEEDGAYYFMIWTVKAQVEWGGTKGTYTNHTVTRISFRGDKICKLREWSNPLKWIEAAGREIPVFKMNIPMCNELAKAVHTPAVPVPQYDLSPEACRERLVDNVKRFMSTEPGYAGAPIQAEKGYQRHVMFVPHEMREELTPEEREYFDYWLACGVKQPWVWGPDAVCYETEDPTVYYFEPCGYGVYHWPGNEEFGMFYTNRYIFHIEMDEQGFCKRYDEYLNPIMKMNSINKSVPSFPWLF